MAENLLVTGSRGGNTPHVTADQQMEYNAGAVGSGQYVMSGMEATTPTSNTVHISQGTASMNGADVSVPAGGIDVTIPSGTQGMLRNDLICLRYKDDSVPTVELICLSGTPDASSPEDPLYNEGSILDGSSPVDMPLYRISLNGVNINTPVKLFKTVPTVADLGSEVDKVESVIGGIKGIYSGSKVVVMTSSWAVLFTKDEYKSKFGSYFDQDRDIVLAMNGDSIAQNTVVRGTFYNGTDVCFSVGTATSGRFRVNYVVIRG